MYSNNDSDQDKLAEKVTQGSDLVDIILELMKMYLTEAAITNDNGDVNLPPYKYLHAFVMCNEELNDAIEKIVREHYEELSDQITYKKRAAWSEQRRKDRDKIKD